MDWSWLFDILRSILFWLDTVIYGFIGNIYELLHEIAGVTIFGNETINAISNKIYALLGIFMLFKVSFSILSYIVSPDDFYDKNKGFGKIITDIVVTLAILVVMPWIFNKAMEIQGVILRDNIIGNILLTDETSKKQSILTTGKEAAGREMAFTTFTAFFKVNPKVCTTGGDEAEKLNTDDYFKEAIECLGGPDSQYGMVYAAARDGRDIRTFANNAGIVNLKSNDKKEYVFEYNYIISTLSGGFILLILILFCFDVGVRTIKLGFLRMIAPIPIISRIDPKKGKEVFDKFVKTCINTYLDLFIRLLSINLAVFIISILQVGIYDATDPGTKTSISFLGMVFIILGALLFAKQFPQLLKDIFGIKFDGSFTLNPVKKLRFVPLASAAIGGVAGAATSAIGKWNANRELGHGLGRTIGSTALGVFSGAGRGFKAGMHDDGKGKFLKSSLDAAKQGAANIYKNKGSTFMGRNIARVQQGLGINTQADVIDRQLKEYDNAKSHIDSIFSRANGEMIKNNYNFKDSVGGTIDMQFFKEQKEYLNSLRNMDTSGMTASQLNTHVQDINYMQEYVSKTEKLAEQAYVDEVIAGRITDDEVTARLGALDSIVSSSNDATVSSVSTNSGAGLKAGKDSVASAKATTEYSSRTVTAQANKRAAGNGNSK